MAERDYLFVYGTLQKDIFNSPRVLLAQHSAFVGGATFRGRLYDLCGYPDAVPSDEPSDIVKGELHHLPRTTERPGCECGKECSGLPRRDVPQSHGRKSVVRGLHESDRVFRDLDQNEGCGPAQPPPTEFRRQRVVVRLESSRKVTAWIYLYNHPTGRLRGIPSGDYLKFHPFSAPSARKDLPGMHPSPHP